ncbi:MAG TPA: hypothetical protein VMW41_03115 [Candidatus Bathyarchaeia archaeon]|nr:hypothetical protein [Candidatus Bathyarchaeia archaeon]
MQKIGRILWWSVVVGSCLGIVIFASLLAKSCRGEAVVQPPTSVPTEASTPLPGAEVLPQEVPVAAPSDGSGEVFLICGATLLLLIAVGVPKLRKSLKG